MSFTEQQQWMQHYIAQGAVSANEFPNEAALRTAYYLTDGNPHELRKYGSVLCCEGSFEAESKDERREVLIEAEDGLDQGLTEAIA